MKYLYLSRHKWLKQHEQLHGYRPEHIPELYKYTVLQTHCTKNALYYKHALPYPSFASITSLIARKAFPRWLMAFLSSADSSAVVQPYSGT